MFGKKDVKMAEMPKKKVYLLDIGLESGDINLRYPNRKARDDALGLIRQAILNNKVISLRDMDEGVIELLQPRRIVKWRLFETEEEYG